VGVCVISVVSFVVWCFSCCVFVCVTCSFSYKLCAFPGDPRNVRRNRRNRAAARLALNILTCRPQVNLKLGLTRTCVASFAPSLIIIKCVGGGGGVFCGYPLGVPLVFCFFLCGGGGGGGLWFFVVTLRVNPLFVVLLVSCRLMCGVVHVVGLTLNPNDRVIPVTCFSPKKLCASSGAPRNVRRN